MVGRGTERGKGRGRGRAGARPRARARAKALRIQGLLSESQKAIEGSHRRL